MREWVKSLPGRGGEAGPVLLVLVVALVAGGAYLMAWVDTIGPAYGVEPSWFASSVMVATGHGFVFPKVPEMPALEAFLRQETMWLDPKALPDHPNTHEVLSFEACHPYLVQSVGWTWRLFGISWHTLKVLPLLMFAVSAAFVYGIFRLGMNRAFSFLGALLFMWTPAVLIMVPSLRDFGKVPFLLGAVFLMGCIIRFRLGRGRYLGLCALLGLLLGVGMGFRQDALPFAPLALVVAMGAAQGDRRRLGVLMRVAGATVLAAGFLFPSWRVLINMRSGQSEQAHHLIQGLTTPCFDQLGMARPAYEFAYMTNDYYVYAIENSYNRRISDKNPFMIYDNPAAAEAGRDWVKQVAVTCPADLITRGYAAVLWGMGNTGVHIKPGLDFSPFIENLQRRLLPLGRHFAGFGAVYVCSGLLLLAARSWRRGLFALLLVLYACGYVSLLFEFRHCFHIAFVPVWFALFVADKVLYGLWLLRFPEARREAGAAVRSPSRWWCPAVRRAFVFAAVTLLVLLGGLYAARAWQHFAVGGMLARAEASTLAPVTTTVEDRGEWQVHRPTATIPGLGGVPAAEVSETPTAYLVAEFAPSDRPRQVWVRYRQGNIENDFSHFFEVRPSPAGDDGPMRYFFPVFEVSVPLPRGPGRPVQEYARGAFEGLGVHRDDLADFRGLYQVDDLSRFPILPHLSLPSDWRRARRVWRLGDGPRGWRSPYLEQ